MPYSCSSPAEVTENGIDIIKGKPALFEPRTVTLCASNWKDLAIRFAFVRYEGGKIELVTNPNIKANFKVTDDFLYPMDYDNRLILGAVQWKNKASRLLGH